MINIVIGTYRWLFARPVFYNLNKLLYHCSLRGLGVLNYESDSVSGEKNFLEKYLRTLPDDGCVIDVGANVGNYSKLVLEIKSSLSIHAFEPHPVTFAKLSKEIKSEKFFPVNAAVGVENGDITLFDYESDDGSSHASIYKGVIEDIHHKKSVGHSVQVIRLGDYLRSKNIDSIDLLKIDTEGNELNVLKGIAEFIKSGKVTAIHFEFNEMNVISRTYFSDFWNELHQYDIYRLLPNSLLKIEKYNPTICEIFAYQNIVAIYNPNVH